MFLLCHFFISKRFFRGGFLYIEKNLSLRIEKSYLESMRNIV